MCKALVWLYSKELQNLAQFPLDVCVFTRLCKLYAAAIQRTITTAWHMSAVQQQLQPLSLARTQHVHFGGAASGQVCACVRHAKQ
jgi:hypothetical protein